MCSPGNYISINLVPGGYIPRLESKERECWKFLDKRLNSENDSRLHGQPSNASINNPVTARLKDKSIRRRDNFRLIIRQPKRKLLARKENSSVIRSGQSMSVSPLLIIKTNSSVTPPLEETWNWR